MCSSLGFSQLSILLNCALWGLLPHHIGLSYSKTLEHAFSHSPEPPLEAQSMPLPELSVDISTVTQYSRLSAHLPLLPWHNY